MSIYSLKYMIPTMVGCPGHLIETQHVRCTFDPFGGIIKPSNLLGLGLSAP